MKVKTRKLTGAALDWAVAKCEGRCPELRATVSKEGKVCRVVDIVLYNPREEVRYYQPALDWSQGGPILTREHISRTIDHSGLWIAYWTDGYTEGDEGKKWMQCDRSELVAGLRCYVASKLGDEVDVPEELR